MNTTIAAQATPPGRGGVAIVRVSGPLVKNIMLYVLGKTILPRQTYYLPFYDNENNMIDEGIAIYFPSPHSFTGEDVLEFHLHGSPIIVDCLLQTLLHHNVKLAKPGEFSERAFLNNKIDLTQAEAIADLIHASSKQAARSALRSLQGEFSSIVEDIKEQLIQIRIYIEAAIDFVEEEIDFLSNQTIVQKLALLMQNIQALQNKAEQGNLLHSGITIVIAGKPNVGKSSLLNCLSAQDLAIVTDIPGTTRDLLHHQLMIDGLPVKVIDTAGLRESEDPIEQEGMRRAHQEIKQADLILYVYDTDCFPQMKFENKVIYIRNKIDLTNDTPSIKKEIETTIVSISVKQNKGIDLLKQIIKQQVGFNADVEDVFIARKRHVDALARVAKHINQAYSQLSTHQFGELAAEDLRQAQLALSEITGEFTSDDLLGQIFSSFCIGK